MIVDVQVPVQGLTIAEATLIGWTKNVGDTVTKGEPLFVIETDKASQEIECPATGTLLVCTASEGDVVKLGAVIGVIGTEAGDVAPPAESRDAARPVGPVGPARPVGPSEAEPARPTVQFSPRARRAAERLGVDISTVTPGGGRGRHVRERDVIEAAAGRETVRPAPAGETRATSRIRRATAERTAASFRDTPHFYLSREADAERLVALREELVSDPSTCGGVRITVTDMLVRALALAMRSSPSTNAQWCEGRIIELHSIDIGIATDTPDGLVVPVIACADRLTLCEIAARRKDLTDRAKAGRFMADELTGGSFTLSNLGLLDVDQFQAVINPPQSGILSAGTIRPRPFVVGEQLTVRRTVVLTLLMDHRVIDGAEAARFLQRIVQLIERPALLLVS
jgi:pyruvate dehydrogenase E2 component (dihydrolipoamide acetyltransferase)